MQFRHIYISLCIIIVGFICPWHLTAQDSAAAVKKAVYVHSSFYYDFPKSTGVSAGIDFVLKSKIKISRDKNGNQKITYRDLIMNADIGFYRYRFNNTGIFIIPSIGKRYSTLRPYYFEILAGAGLVKTFYDGIVYSVDDSGKLSEKNNFGRYYATANLSMVFGWDFEKSKQPAPFALQVKPVLWFQFPYNSFVLPHLALEVGFKYHFKNFNTTLKQKEIRIKWPQ